MISSTLSSVLMVLASLSLSSSSPLLPLPSLLQTVVTGMTRTGYN